MGDISKNFSRWEFACKDNCGFDTVDVELLKLLELIRTHFNQPVTITSGCRCYLRNIAEHGAFKSKHLLGSAADIVVKDVKPEDVYKFVDGHAPNKYGVGISASFVHVDVRAEKTRWTY